MTRITVDATTVTQLARLPGPVQLCDENGSILGWYRPGILSEPPPSLKKLSPFSDQELQQRGQQPGGRPLKDILRKLDAE